MPRRPFESYLLGDAFLQHSLALLLLFLQTRSKEISTFRISVAVNFLCKPRCPFESYSFREGYSFSLPDLQKKYNCIPSTHAAFLYKITRDPDKATEYKSLYLFLLSVLFCRPSCCIVSVCALKPRCIHCFIHLTTVYH